MRVVLLTYGSRGDVEPMAGLALALRELGAEVRVCAPPDFEELLAGIGVPLVPIGPSVRALATDALTGKPTKLPPTMAERAAGLFDSVYETVAPVAAGSDLVVATGLLPAAAGARAAAEKAGVPYAFVSYFPSYLPSPHHPPLAFPGHPLPADVTDNRVLWDQNAEILNELFGGAVNAQRAQLGLPPVPDLRDHVLTDRPLLAADPALSPWQEPADLDVVQTGAWIRTDARPLPEDLEKFLAAGAPPVYVGFGSMPLRDAADVSRAAVEAVRARGRRVLLGRGWADLALIDGADDCFVVGEVNQQELFRRVAAVAHHGGAGTTTTAARAGAPQVVVAQMADQPYWAGRIAELGIGAAHDGPTPTYASLTAALTVALAPETRERARSLAAEVRTDGATVAAKLLLEEAAAG
ncbi:glycosyltransferase [Streptomyces aquilus]|uniref:Glycosyltransferase n=1 Tax=Streptomyces aquilus TaxID=2548456 RepID=A0A3S9I6W3_9ACTN|nr:glycosyltransferase [Streptomyces aquilus]AZP20107.1 glycosyltransferase [Streptomyces aquilus]